MMRIHCCAGFYTASNHSEYPATHLLDGQSFGSLAQQRQASSCTRHGVTQAVGRFDKYMRLCRICCPYCCDVSTGAAQHSWRSAQCEHLRALQSSTGAGNTASAEGDKQCPLVNITWCMLMTRQHRRTLQQLKKQ